MSILSPIVTIIRNQWASVLVWGVMFAIGAQALQLIMLMLRFDAFPNYLITYDWVGNAVRIINSTPSVKDMFPILFEEWWIEIGFMNYDFGNGISEWSLNVIPSRLFILATMGMLLKLFVVLLGQKSCSPKNTAFAYAGAGVGTLLISMTTAAMSWVVCCAAPSWVVGLAMLGLSVSASLALEGLGPSLFFSGFFFLVGALLFLSSRITKYGEDGKRIDALADCIDARTQSSDVGITNNINPNSDSSTLSVRT